MHTEHSAARDIERDRRGSSTQQEQQHKQLWQQVHSQSANWVKELLWTDFKEQKAHSGLSGDKASKERKTQLPDSRACSL